MGATSRCSSKHCRLVFNYALYVHDRRYADTTRPYTSAPREVSDCILSVGCTATTVAECCEEIRVVDPQVVIVEDAGQILENRVLAALTPSTKRLVLLGDHR